MKLLDPGEWWTRGECGLSRRTGGASRADPCDRSKGSSPIFLPQIYEYKASTWLVLRHCFTRLEPYHFQQTSIEFGNFPTFPWWNHPIRGTLPSCRYPLPLSMQRPRWDDHLSCPCWDLRVMCAFHPRIRWVKSLRELSYIWWFCFLLTVFP